MAGPLEDLSRRGVSVWLDDLSRRRLTSGSLAELVARDHVVGVTTNPTIFAKAIAAGAEEYAGQLDDLRARGAGVDEAVRAMTTDDVRGACDTEVDARLDKIGTAAAAGLRGRAAIVNARLAYQRYEAMTASPRWAALAADGARPQRPLWASTSVKDPAYPDTRYVTDLVAPGVVNTMPFRLVKERKREMSGSAYVIAGAGLAGAKAAETLRAEGFDGPIVLIGDETERPYERPPLSKDYLLGKAERETIFVHPQAWYADNGVELRLGSPVTGIDRAAHEMALADGSRVGYAKLLLATGSSPRRLTVPGADADGVHYLRRAADSDQIKAAFQTASRVAVIGAGWIGLETAAAARAAGAEVTIMEAAELPLLRVLGPEVAQVFADLHRQHGADLRFGVQVEEISVAGGRASGVRMADGSQVEADAVIVGVGITPNSQLAEAAGLETGNGIVVDAGLRSSDPDIFAAGDVASAYHPLLGRHIRVEHWANALNQPQAAARAMLGQDVAYDRVPYFYSDQYDLGMEYAGYVEPGGYDQVVFRGDKDKREFVAFWLAGGRVLAGMNVNVWDVNDAIQDLVRGGQTADPARLADPGVPLDQVAS